MSRVAPLAALGIVVVALGCREITDARRRLVTYQIATLDCLPNDCSAPNDTLGVTAADRGDTVWVFSGVEGGTPGFGDGALITVRADCDVNVRLTRGQDTTTVGTFPTTVTCPDSTFDELVYRFPDPVDFRVFQWVIDSLLTPGEYFLEGVMVVSPDLRPILAFEVR